MKFLRSLSVYTLGNFLNAGSAFLLLPIITSYLTPEQNGIFSLLNLSISILFALLSLSSHGIIQAEFYRLDRPALAKFISSALFNNLLALVLATLLTPLSTFFLDWKHQIFWIACLPFIAFLKTIHQVVLALLQSLNRPTTYFVLNTGLVVLTLLLSFVFVKYVGLKWEGLLLGILVAQFLIAMVGLASIGKEGLIIFSINLNLSKTALWFGLPLIPHALGSLAIEASNRIFIANMVDVASLGVYDVGFQIGKVIGLIEVSFNAAYIPFLYENLTRNDDRSKLQIVRVSYIFLALLFLAVLVLHFSKDIIFLFIDEQYAGATDYILIVSMGYFFSGVYKVFVGFIFYFKKVSILGYLAIANVAVNVILNYLLIGYMGTIGAALATSISFLINAIVIAFVVNKLYEMPWFKFGAILNNS